MKRALLAAVMLPVANASAASLYVTVQNVPSEQGHVLVAVCPQAVFLSRDCPYTGIAPARKGSVTVRVSGIPSGTYAVQAFQDKNDNMNIDRNFFGLPTEAMGFSNNAPMRFGPPRYGDAAIRIGPGDGRISLKLRQFGG